MIFCKWAPISNSFVSPYWSSSYESLSSPLSDALVTIYSPSEGENSSVWLDYGLGFASFLLLSLLLITPAPSLISFLSLLTLLDFENVFNVDEVFEVAFYVDNVFDLFPTTDEVRCFFCVQEMVMYFLCSDVNCSRECCSSPFIPSDPTLHLLRWWVACTLTLFLLDLLQISDTYGSWEKYFPNTSYSSLEHHKSYHEDIHHNHGCTYTFSAQ